MITTRMGHKVDVTITVTQGIVVRLHGEGAKRPKHARTNGDGTWVSVIEDATVTRDDDAMFTVTGHGRYVSTPVTIKLHIAD